MPVDIHFCVINFFTNLFPVRPCAADPGADGFSRRVPRRPSARRPQVGARVPPRTPSAADAVCGVPGAPGQGHGGAQAHDPPRTDRPRGSRRSTSGTATAPVKRTHRGGNISSHFCTYVLKYNFTSTCIIVENEILVLNMSLYINLEFTQYLHLNRLIKLLEPYGSYPFPVSIQSTLLTCERRPRILQRALASLYDYRLCIVFVIRLVNLGST